MRLWSSKRSKVDSDRLQLFVERLLMYTKGVRGVCVVSLMGLFRSLFFLVARPSSGISHCHQKSVREGWQGE